MPLMAKLSVQSVAKVIISTSGLMFTLASYF
jgi:hypothetical protein